jgi:hypothetical protein
LLVSVAGSDGDIAPRRTLLVSVAGSDGDIAPRRTVAARTFD